MSAVSLKIKRFGRDKRASSAVEFALLAPLMIGLYLGGVEISEGISVDRKVTLAAGAVANLAAQTATLVESGVDFVSAQWFGLFAPAKTPEPIVLRLSELHNQALRDPGVAGRITEQGGFLRPGTPEDFTRFIEGEIAAWGEIVRTANVTQ